MPSFSSCHPPLLVGVNHVPAELSELACCIQVPCWSSLGIQRWRYTLHPESLRLQEGPTKFVILATATGVDCHWCSQGHGSMQATQGQVQGMARLAALDRHPSPSSCMVSARHSAARAGLDEPGTRLSTCRAGCRTTRRERARCTWVGCTQSVPAACMHLLQPVNTHQATAVTRFCTAAV